MAVYEYPSFASSGLHLIFFLIVGGIFWFIPVALVAAEMATVKGWESGGIYRWIGATLGQRWGFAAIFYQFLEISVGFVTMVFFVLAALAYLFHWDALYENPLVMFIGVAIVVWALTFTQMGGTKLTAKIAQIGFLGGILVPVVVLIIGLIAYLATGGTNYLAQENTGIIPNFADVGTLVIFATFILSYAGVEASAPHVNELRNPNRTYPAVMIVLCVLAIVLSSIGGICVAITMPMSTLDANMSYGVIEAFVAMFTTQLHMGWVPYVMAVLLSLGVLAEISAWIVGPSRALLSTAQDGLLPPTFTKTNKHGISVKTLIIQACLVTVWDGVLCGSIALSGGSSSSVGYLTAIGLTVVIYLVAYTLLFIGYFVLVFKHKDLERGFHIPGGTVGKCIFAGCGLLVTLATLVVSFFPSSELSAQANVVYVVTLLICWAIMVAVPFIIYSQRHRWSSLATSPAEAAEMTTLKEAEAALTQAEGALKAAKKDVKNAEHAVQRESAQERKEAQEAMKSAQKVAKAAEDAVHKTSGGGHVSHDA